MKEETSLEILETLKTIKAFYKQLYANKFDAVDNVLKKTN